MGRGGWRHFCLVRNGGFEAVEKQGDKLTGTPDEGFMRDFGTPEAEAKGIARSLAGYLAGVEHGAAIKTINMSTASGWTIIKVVE